MRHVTGHFLMIRNGGLIWLILFFLWRGNSCENTSSDQSASVEVQPVKAFDDPIFKNAEFTCWLKEDDVENSLVVVADLEKGGIHLTNFRGNNIARSLLNPFCKPNTLDIGYGLQISDGLECDVVGFVDQETNKIRLYRLPELEPIDRGGIQLFDEDDSVVIDGFSLYSRDRDDMLFLLVSSVGSAIQNVWTQFRLSLNDQGFINAEQIREFGTYESQDSTPLTFIDPSQEYFYYSDNRVVRKYYADPNKGDMELAILQADSRIKSLSGYTLESPGGYIAIGEQDRVLFFSGGTSFTRHQHELVKTLSMTLRSVFITSTVLDQKHFSKGALISLSEHSLDWYDWQDISGGQLIFAPNGIPDYTDQAIQPKFRTEPTMFDTDDPAIWINPEDPAQSLIIGTDKEDGGGIYVYDLTGKIQREKTVIGLHRPNNVDLEYGLELAGRLTDFIVATERNNADVRVYSFPEMKPIDGGGIPVFQGEEKGDPMGIALYKDPLDGEIFAIVGRKNGPSDGYLWQYKVVDDGTGTVQFMKVREFGEFSGNKEIEAIAVDDELGFVYYSDEGIGVRKYYADPEKGNNELAIFGQLDFGQDHEGISIFYLENGRGYILVSDQQRNRFNIYPREGSNGSPHDHKLIKSVEVSTMESDGSEVTSHSLGNLFPKGLLVAMSTDRTFHYYDWRDIAGDDLDSK